MYLILTLLQLRKSFLPRDSQDERETCKDMLLATPSNYKSEIAWDVDLNFAGGVAGKTF